MSPPAISLPCPLTALVDYRLTFWADRQRYPSTTVETYCQQTQPWLELGQAMKLRRPGMTAFTGGVGFGAFKR